MLQALPCNFTRYLINFGLKSWITWKGPTSLPNFLQEFGVFGHAWQYEDSSIFLIMVLSSLGFLVKEIHLTPHLANTKESRGSTYIWSNGHKHFFFLVSVMNQALKFRPLVVFAYVWIMDGSGFHCGSHKNKK